MSTTDNKAFLRKYVEALSGKPKPASVVDLYIAEQGLKDHIAAFEAGFPEYVFEPEEMIAEGDKVSVKARLRATHLGSFNGLPPTGKTVELPFHITYQIREGKIVDHWMVFDSLDFMQQLGVIPVQAS
jgi:predicted ester cyclase